MSLTLDLVGFDTIGEKLKTASESVFKEVDAEIEASIKEMRLKAIQDAPNDQGTLRQEISIPPQEKPLEWSLVSGAFYSAFVEFGTKGKRSIPPGLEEEAEKFRGLKGGSLSAQDAIFKWCARHGIPEKFWRWIFIQIMVNGVSPRPFFFKQLEAEKPNLLNRLQQIL